MKQEQTAVNYLIKTLIENNFIKTDQLTTYDDHESSLQKIVNTARDLEKLQNQNYMNDGFTKAKFIYNQNYTNDHE